jgi:hypothetical protein
MKVFRIYLPSLTAADVGGGNSSIDQMKKSGAMFLALGNALAQFSKHSRIVLKTSIINSEIIYLIAVEDDFANIAKQIILSSYETAKLEPFEGIFDVSDVEQCDIGFEKDARIALMSKDEAGWIDLHRLILDALQDTKGNERAEISLTIKLPEKRFLGAVNLLDKLSKNKDEKPPNAAEQDKRTGMLLEARLSLAARANSQSRTSSLLRSLQVALTSHFGDHGEYNRLKVLGRRSIADKIRQKIGLGQIFNNQELASLFYLPSAKISESSKIKRQMIKETDGPDSDDSGLFLGENTFHGGKKPVHLSNNDRRRHSYILGQTGTGKSRMLENLALQDLKSGRGFAFIDPHGDSAEMILSLVPDERKDDIIYFNPADLDFPIGLNLFEYDKARPYQRDFVIQEAIAILYALYDPNRSGIIGPRYEHWFRSAALTLMSDPDGCSFLEVPKLFTDEDFLKYQIQFVKDDYVLDFWYKEMKQVSSQSKSEMLGWFVAKFGAFASNQMMRGIIGQYRSGFDFRQIMDNNKVLIVNLSKGRLGEINSNLIGMILVMKMMMAAMSRADIPEDQRRDFSLYVDEFQSFSTDSFATLLSEARKYHFDLILANQFMSQLSRGVQEAILGNVGTIICGRIGPSDADILEKRFKPAFDAIELTRLPNFQAVASVMIDNTPSGAFNLVLPQPLNTDERCVSHPQRSCDFYNTIVEASRRQFGLPKNQIEQIICTKKAKCANNLTVVDNKITPNQTQNCTHFLSNWQKIKQNL